jgi:hypothetical protein
MEYGLTDVCKKMLDNADMILNLSSYPAIELKFIVHGSVDEKFWEVRFLCGGTIDLKIENESDVTSNDIHLVLEVNVTGKPTEEISENLKFRINEPVTQKVWFIDVHGHMSIELMCSKFQWSLNELTKQQYESKYA